MAYGFYPNIPNNQVGVEIDGSRNIRVINQRLSPYSMIIDGKPALNLVNSKVTSHNTWGLPASMGNSNQERQNAINALSRQMNDFARLGDGLFFFKFKNQPGRLSYSGGTFKYLPNGEAPALPVTYRTSTFNQNLPTFKLDVGINFGANGSGIVNTYANSSGISCHFRIANAQPSTAYILENAVREGMEMSYELFVNAKYVQVFTDRSKPAYGLQVNSPWGEIYYPNSNSKLNNSGNYLIVPVYSNFDFNSFTVNGISLANKYVCISSAVSSVIAVDF